MAADPEMKGNLFTRLFEDMKKSTTSSFRPYDLYELRYNVLTKQKAAFDAALGDAVFSFRNPSDGPGIYGESTEKGFLDCYVVGFWNVDTYGETPMHALADKTDLQTPQYIGLIPVTQTSQVLIADGLLTTAKQELGGNYMTQEELAKNLQDISKDHAPVTADLISLFTNYTATVQVTADGPVETRRYKWVPWADEFSYKERLKPDFTTVKLEPKTFSYGPALTVGITDASGPASANHKKVTMFVLKRLSESDADKAHVPPLTVAEKAKALEDAKAAAAAAAAAAKGKGAVPMELGGGGGAAPTFVQRPPPKVPKLLEATDIDGHVSNLSTARSQALANVEYYANVGSILPTTSKRPGLKGPAKEKPTKDQFDAFLASRNAKMPITQGDWELYAGKSFAESKTAGILQKFDWDLSRKNWTTPSQQTQIKTGLVAAYAAFDVATPMEEEDEATTAVILATIISTYQVYCNAATAACTFLGEKLEAVDYKIGLNQEVDRTKFSDFQVFWQISTDNLEKIHIYAESLEAGATFNFRELTKLLGNYITELKMDPSAQPYMTGIETGMGLAEEVIFTYFTETPGEEWGSMSDLIKELYAAFVQLVFRISANIARAFPNESGMGGGQPPRKKAKPNAPSISGQSGNIAALTATTRALLAAHGMHSPTPAMVAGTKSVIATLAAQADGHESLHAAFAHIHPTALPAACGSQYSLKIKSNFRTTKLGQHLNTQLEKVNFSALGWRLSPDGEHARGIAAAILYAAVAAQKGQLGGQEHEILELANLLAQNPTDCLHAHVISDVDIPGLYTLAADIATLTNSSRGALAPSAPAYGLVPADPRAIVDCLVRIMDAHAILPVSVQVINSMVLQYVRSATSPAFQGASTPSGMFAVALRCGMGMYGADAHPDADVLQYLQEIPQLPVPSDDIPYCGIETLAATLGLPASALTNKTELMSMLERKKFCPQTVNVREVPCASEVPGGRMFKEASEALIGQAIGPGYGRSALRLLVEEVISTNCLLIVERNAYNEVAFVCGPCDVTGRTDNCVEIQFVSLCVQIAGGKYEAAQARTTAASIRIHASICPLLFALYGLKMRLMSSSLKFGPIGARLHAWSSNPSEDDGSCDSAVPYMLTLAAMLDLNMEMYM